ncbi:hypothetical protein QL285_095086 [Trifolium repens]|nr:hypothetical protein QL285_095086 [Trifolium repens]
MVNCSFAVEVIGGSLTLHLKEMAPIPKTCISWSMPHNKDSCKISKAKVQDLEQVFPGISKFPCSNLELYLGSILGIIICFYNIHCQF